jgi:hypothetical protein
MLRLQYALWRRDVAQRKLTAYLDGGVRYSSKVLKLKQRVERWNTLIDFLVSD